MDQHLQVFVKVAERENFSRAAEELHMTQPAVSQYIRTLEESMGARLLERNNKYVRLNKAGKIVYHHAKEILALYSQMQNLVDDLTNHAHGPIAIGASYTIGEYILPHMIASLQKDYRQIHPSIIIKNSTEIIELVKKRQLDIGLIEGVFNKQHLSAEVLSEDKMVIVAAPGHPLLQKNRISLSDLAAETWILRERGSGTREAAENLFRTYGISPANTMEFGSTQVIKESVQAGLGISLLSTWAIQKEQTNGYIAIMNVAGLPFKRNFSIITPSPYLTKSQQVFIQTATNFLGGRENYSGG